jgi:hypothetical protein
MMRPCVASLAAAVTLVSVAPATAQTPVGKADTIYRGATMHAHGTFDVNIISQPPEDATEGSTVFGRMLLDKRFHGDLDAVSKGQMLTGMTEVKGSGVYVAIEQVKGTLQGRSGSFILHHLGVMLRGAPQLNVSVVQDSGTGALTGIEGTMTIIITDGKHSYDFDYTLPEAH